MTDQCREELRQMFDPSDPEFRIRVLKEIISQCDEEEHTIQALEMLAGEYYGLACITIDAADRLRARGEVEAIA